MRTTPSLRPASTSAAFVDVVPSSRDACSLPVSSPWSSASSRPRACSRSASIVSVLGFLTMVAAVGLFVFGQPGQRAAKGVEKGNTKSRPRWAIAWRSASAGASTSPASSRTGLPPALLAPSRPVAPLRPARPSPQPDGLFRHGTVAAEPARGRSRLGLQRPAARRCRLTARLAELGDGARRSAAPPGRPHGARHQAVDDGRAARPGPAPPPASGPRPTGAARPGVPACRRVACRPARARRRPRPRSRSGPPARADGAVPAGAGDARGRRRVVSDSADAPVSGAPAPYHSRSAAITTARRSSRPRAVQVRGLGQPVRGRPRGLRSVQAESVIDRQVLDLPPHGRGRTRPARVAGREPAAPPDGPHGRRHRAERAQHAAARGTRTTRSARCPGRSRRRPVVRGRRASIVGMSSVLSPVGTSSGASPRGLAGAAGGGRGGLGAGRRARSPVARPGRRRAGWGRSAPSRRC